MTACGGLPVSAVGEPKTRCRLILLPANLTASSFDDLGRRVIKFEGELDVAGVSTARSALSEDFDVLDFSELEFLDSSGVRILVEACRDRTTPPVVRGLKGQVLRILVLTGISEMFVIDEPGRSDGTTVSPVT